MTTSTTPVSTGYTQQNSVPSWTWMILWLFVVGFIILGIIAFAKEKKAKKKEKAKLEMIEKAKADSIRKATFVPLPPPEYPTAGEGWATEDMPVKAYLDPLKTYTRASSPVRYVNTETNEEFIDTLLHVKGVSEREIALYHKEWYQMNAGEYLIFAYETSRAKVRWSRKKISGY